MMFQSTRALLLIVCLSLLRVHGISAQQECDAAGGGSGTCGGGGGEATTSCNKDSAPSPSSAACSVPSSLYDDGGTAVAYTPNAPESSTVCQASNYTISKYRAARWPWTRSVWKQAPQISLKLNLLGCSSSTQKDPNTIDSSGSRDKSCCCRALPPEVDATVEVWQARPDGTYSSLRDAASGDCRARASTRRSHAASSSSSSSTIVFDTVAPGSVGSLGGLGGRDSMPFGPPVIHAMVHAHGFAPVLIDVPVSLDMATMAATSGCTDFRGAAWVRRPSDAHYRIASWRGDAQRNTVELEVDILLPKSADAAATTSSASASTLCPSFAYGMPSSFFFEPIAVCAPSMLNFFNL